MMGREKILERDTTYNNTVNGGVDHVELVDNAALPNAYTATIDGARPQAAPSGRSSWRISRDQQTH